ncbi:energy transducer TonB [Methylococcus geothermalis]|uniref:TonB family protein n=1 Tax=Methylococcus geothermalis TaxID=2681310 RepID=A0A858QB32_9GAMM|nr:energy transducer TonB [Methylococcus geothermalis]QJD31033.1 TonB family protein [Methylococcus geothermalis]
MSLESHDQGRLLLALLIAFAVHVAAIFSLNAKLAATPREPSRTFEVTLLRLPAREAPKQAEHLAAENQRGDEKRERVEPLPSRGVEKPAETAPHRDSRQASATERPPRKPVLKSPRIEQSVKAEPELEAAPPAHISAESLSRQIAEFGAAYVRQQEEAPRPRMVYINSVNAHKYKAAAYERAWQDKIERIGNLNYPEEARRRNLTGSLLLSVALRPDGSVYKVQVRRSSGEQALDDAAVRIVHLAAPFAPFPVELREEADVLVITRTWKFLNGTRLETAP